MANLARASGLLAVCVAGLSAAAFAGLEPPNAFVVESAPGLAPQPPATLDELIADLSSTDFRKRELAAVRIREDQAVRLSDLENILTTRELSLEARARLVTIARERFSSTPRGAMGVQFEQQTLRDRIVIDDTFAPFDCHKRLEPGDILIEADGIPLSGPTGRTTIQGLIISHDPGDVMKVVVRRGKEKLSFDIRLGDFRELRNNVLDEGRLLRAWRTRSQAFTQPGEAIKTPVHLDAWPDALQASRMRQMQQMRIQPASPTMLVHGGGRARSSNLINDFTNYPMQFRGANGDRINAVGANAQAMQMFLDFDDPNPQPRMTFAEEVDSLQRKRALVESQLENARRNSRPAAGTAEAALTESRLTRLETSLRAVDRQLEAITAEQSGK